MFKVTQVGDGYKISIGTGRPVLTRFLEEVHNALNHYYQVNHYGSPNPRCPFCTHQIHD